MEACPRNIWSAKSLTQSERRDGQIFSTLHHFSPLSHYTKLVSALSIKFPSAIRLILAFHTDTYGTSDRTSSRFRIRYVIFSTTYGLTLRLTLMMLRRTWCKGREIERAYKPGSVPFDTVTTIPLRRMSPSACSDLPESWREPRPLQCSTLPYLVLLQVGFTLPPTLVGAVRSYRTISPLPAHEALGGIFSVALSVDSRPPGVTWHFALRSPDFPLCVTRVAHSGRPARSPSSVTG